MMRARNCAFILLVSLLVFGVVSVCSAGNDNDDDDDDNQKLSKNFYRKSCPGVEELVKTMTWSKVESNRNLGAKLLRMHFHDCFVRGCDGSVLLDAVDDNTQAEKDAIPNLTLAGFELIDDIKAKLEKRCPEVVSCADILALAAQYAVSFPLKKPFWDVLLGRKDGNVSLASDIDGNLPSPFSDFTTLLQIFTKKGLTLDDLVALSGGHTLGVARCGTFSNRLYNFTGKGDADPSLDTEYAKTLEAQCPDPANPAPTVELDPNSSQIFDNNYFGILLQKKGLLQSDAALLTDGDSAAIVEKLTKPNAFLRAFAKSMKKMGEIGVLTGEAGEIRKQCRVVNS